VSRRKAGASAVKGSLSRPKRTCLWIDRHRSSTLDVAVAVTQEGQSLTFSDVLVRLRWRLSHAYSRGPRPNTHVLLRRRSRRLVLTWPLGPGEQKARLGQRPGRSPDLPYPSSLLCG
jgi:hypothetical protein